MVSATSRVDLLLVVAVIVILASVLYTLCLYVLSRFEPSTSRFSSVRRLHATSTQSLRVVFVVPCLNEERVIAGCVERLLALPAADAHVLVVDDGSSDRTAEIVEGYVSSRVHLLRRTLPEARMGKGEALNAAIRHVRGGAVTGDLDRLRTIICVVDADGMMEAHALDVVLPLFAAPRLGAVQIGVRINNRHRSVLARMQDIEFTVLTGIYQRGRRHLHSVSLGGNGQFVRLEALDDLGESPWSHSLTEDLDLGIRLLLSGWETEFCGGASVHQQGLTDVGRWLRQRTRWFQGHMQSWSLLPRILGEMRGVQRADLFYHVTSVLILLLGSLLAFGSVFWFLALVVAALSGHGTFSAWWLSAYAVSFGPAILFSIDYWRAERRPGMNWLTAVAYLHLYVLYSSLWYIAGWRAVWRTLLRTRSWTKTERVDNEPVLLETSSTEHIPMLGRPAA